MRWKLVLLATLVAAIAAFGIWLAITLAVFGSAAALARNDLIFFGSLVVPIGFSAFASIFVYRHTAKRRKPQAIVTAVLTLLFTIALYLFASFLFHARLVIPRTSEVRHAR